MTPPDRFESARFETYEPASPSQGEALAAIRRFVDTCRRTPTVAERVKQVFGMGSNPQQHGLYLVGPAGTGKTHLLAAAYHALTPQVPCAFLHSSTLFRSTESPSKIGRDIAAEHDVCCLDEVEIDDPANEMRLVALMKTLSARDVPLLATSNVEPEEYLSAQLGGGRFQRFLEQEFRNRYRLIHVAGADYRRKQNLRRDGHGWIGPPETTRPVMKKAFEKVDGSSKWLTFSGLQRAATELSHTRLIDAITSLDHYFVEGIRIDDTDGALRLLRIVDSLYLHEDAPALYFTAQRPPEDWFTPKEHAGVAKSIAEKFSRTVSRLHAMCTLHTCDSKKARLRNVPSP